MQRIRRSRMFGWDRNPVRRRIDRVEGGMLLGLIVLFLMVAPALAVTAGHLIGAAGLRQQRTEATWRQVPAVVQRGAAPRDLPGDPGTVAMLARWTAPDGQPRTGWVAVSVGTAAGSSARVWVNHRGAPTGPPLSSAQLQGQIVITGAAMVWGLAFLLVFVGGAGRYVIRRRRLAAWGTAWRAVERGRPRQR